MCSTCIFTRTAVEMIRICIFDLPKYVCMILNDVYANFKNNHPIFTRKQCAEAHKAKAKKGGTASRHTEMAISARIRTEVGTKTEIQRNNSDRVRRYDKRIARNTRWLYPTAPAYFSSSSSSSSSSSAPPHTPTTLSHLLICFLSCFLSHWTAFIHLHSPATCREAAGYF